MIVDETEEVQQSIKDIPRNNSFKIPRATCPATKIEIHHGCFLQNLQNFRAATF